MATLRRTVADRTTLLSQLEAAETTARRG